MEKIKVTRKTTESEMNVVLDFAPLKKDYRKYIKTPIPFLNHMIEHITCVKTNSSSFKSTSILTSPRHAICSII